MTRNALQSSSAVWQRCCLALLLLVAFFSLSATVMAQTPEVGARAPDFSLHTPEGLARRLSDLTGKGPVVLVVLRGYPGYQCPYCQKQVHDFVDNASRFADEGAQVLLVYPGPPASLDLHAKEFLSTQASLPANISLVLDPEYTVTILYGLRWDAPHETAYPSTFILNGKRVILYRHISRTHGDRSSAKDVLAQLSKAKQGHGY